MKTIETIKNEFKTYETVRYIRALMKSSISDYGFYVSERAAKLQKKLIDEMGASEFMKWLYAEVYSPIDAFMGGK